MSENVTIFKFLFKATISTFNLNANISSPLVVTWKRSNESAVSTPVQMTSGKAQINQTLSLPVNMYFDNNTQSFQQKKSVFTFTMNTPKGDKQAGVIYINLAKQCNQKIEVLQGKYSLQKCPVKNSQVKISIIGECIGQKNNDTMSQSSYVMQQNPSMLSIQSKYKKSDKIEQNQSQKQNKSEAQLELQNKDKFIKQLQVSVARLQKDNQKLSQQLKRQKENSKHNAVLNSTTDQGKLILNMKQELIKSKSIQQKLQNQISCHRCQNAQHEKQLQKTRVKMQKLYQVLCSHFDIDI